MNKKYSLKTLVIAVCVCVAVAVMLTSVLFAFVIVPLREGRLNQYNQKLLEINSLVEKYYMGDVDEEVMKDCLAYGYVAGLNDRYAGYITASDAEANKNSMMGYNTGIGVQVTAHPDTGNIYVSEVHSESPADKAGIKKGDQITALDGQSVAEKGYSWALEYIPTIPLGDKITVDVLRSGTTLTVEIELSVYVAQTVFYEKIDDMGYIAITSFNDKTVEQFKNAVDSLIEQNAAGLIFDVRGNAGGTLNSVRQMVDYLVPEGLIVKVDYKDDNVDETYLSDAHEIDIPMAVLTDENSASASELFAQSLIDFNKAVTVGRKTYGKGVVQTTFTLSDGSQVRFTVAKYYTNSGTCVDGEGITPTVPIEWTEDELKYRYVNGIRADKDYLAAVKYLKAQ